MNANRSLGVRLQAPSASIGIHVATDDDDYDSLLRAADGAMYDAKRSGQGGVRLSLNQVGQARAVEPLG